MADGKNEGFVYVLQVRTTPEKSYLNCTEPEISDGGKQSFSFGFAEIQIQMLREPLCRSFKLHYCFTFASPNHQPWQVLMWLQSSVTTSSSSA
jgi:hypothetical protein